MINQEFRLCKFVGGENMAVLRVVVVVVMVVVVVIHCIDRWPIIRIALCKPLRIAWSRRWHYYMYIWPSHGTFTSEPLKVNIKKSIVASPT